MSGSSFIKVIPYSALMFRPFGSFPYGKDTHGPKNSVLNIILSMGFGVVFSWNRQQYHHSRVADGRIDEESRVHEDASRRTRERNREPRNGDGVGSSQVEIPRICCVKERPLLLPHRAAKTRQVMNYTIPKDSEVLVNIWAIGRDPNHWEDPLEFKPERFVNSSLDFKGTNFDYLPFGAGRRICPGQPLASKQVPLVVASLVQSFDWSPPNGEDPKNLDMAEKYGINMRKKEPLLVVPKARK